MLQVGPGWKTSRGLTAAVSSLEAAFSRWAIAVFQPSRATAATGQTEAGRAGFTWPDTAAKVTSGWRTDGLPDKRSYPTTATPTRQRPVNAI